MSKIRNNKKGFSLAELIVTIVVLGFVCVLTGQFVFQFTNVYNTSEARWEVQSAVTIANRKFETNRESIVNAYEADLLYDPVVANGITLKSDGSFVWRSGRDPYIIPAENSIDHKVEGVKDDPYTYIFSTPAYDESGKLLGSFLYIRHFGESNSELFLDAEGLGDVPVEVQFRMATTIPTRDEDGNEVTDFEKSYLPYTVQIELKSGDTTLTNYSLVSEYSLINVEQRKDQINWRNNFPVCDIAWLDGSEAVAGPAGWNSEEAVKGGPPEEANGKVYGSYYDPARDYYDNAVLTTVEKDGNVMRFISPEAFKTISDADDLTSGANLASCLTSFSFSDPSKLSSHVLGALRDFRDNVLAGTEFGDWFIDEYYNTWSPFLIEKAGFLKPVYRAILIPVSFVCGIVANV